MGALNRYPSSDLPPGMREVPRPPVRKSRARWFIVGAIILVLLVVFGVAIFVARLGGRGPARQGTPKAPPPGLWIASP